MNALLSSAVAVLLLTSAAHSRDLGQWDKADPAISAWFNALKQPDNPAISCCGEADAYWADVALTENGLLVAVVTDDRPDEPLRRRHVPIGTRVVVPQHKIKYDQGNPSGHTVIFLNPSNEVWCYVQNGGV